MGSFIAVGKALLTIRDRRLYREKFDTFNNYCKEKWELERTYAHRLINGFLVVANLVLPRGNLYTPCEIQPIYEKQVRPLCVLEPAQQCEVWEEAVRTAPVGKVCHFRTPAISVSGGGFPDETAETASGLCSGRRWDGPGGPWPRCKVSQTYPRVPLCEPWRACEWH
jgi:hypothetical protein